MTSTREAKQIIKTYLDEHALHYTRLSAKTISFVDFGFGRVIFVKIHGWKPDPKWNDLKKLANKHGFYVEAE